MKLNEKLKCPVCGKMDAHMFGVSQVSLFDDSVYEGIEKEFGANIPVTSLMHSVIYECKCDTCGNYFNALVTLDVQIKDVICVNTLEDAIRLKGSDLPRDK